MSEREFKESELAKIEDGINKITELDERIFRLVKKLVGMGILCTCPNTGYSYRRIYPEYSWQGVYESEIYGYIRYIPKHGRPDKYGWEKVFTPVLRFEKGLRDVEGNRVIWHPAITDPAALLAKLVKKHLQKTEKTIEEVSKLLPKEDETENKTEEESTQKPWWGQEGEIII
ncbi:MAG: hypothetical protein ACPLTR_08440 [Thermacetogeniaceae bacterium]